MRPAPPPLELFGAAPGGHGKMDRDGRGKHTKSHKNLIDDWDDVPPI